MPDPLLTFLCSICHVSAPKYKCPRCGTQTCSLPCTKKHKSWSDCSGRRDPTAYVAPSKLRTAAGVDHDYNFLHGMEVSMERSEKLLVEEKGLVQEEELRPLTMQQVRWRTGRDGRKRKVLVTQALREVKGRKLERGLAQRLHRLNVQVVFVPLGMGRQRENHTTLNRRTGRINWQVEWLAFGGADEEQQQQQQRDRRGATVRRTLSKVMENVPLYEAYHAVLLEERTRGSSGSRSNSTSTSTATTIATTKNSSTRLAEAQQSWGTGRSKWNQGLDCIQDATNATWWAFTGGHTSEWPVEREALQRSQYRFYLAVQGGPVRSDAPVPVTALDSGDCLCDILSNTRVLEFPSIYVLPAHEVLPAGYALVAKDTTTSLKRKDGRADHDDALGKGLGMGKRRKQGGKEEGEGEVDGGRDDDEADEEHDAAKGGGGGGLEAGEILAEQSLGEESEDEDDENDEDDDDDTSSSGSDSE
ncbi:hypothetical protein E4U43_003903 [Claviceps pusilla]|uniref:Box C/D snoRNA protein 1 n=1 Tax=Claviceps pusilla TaxID=123648 RepID=A0A9P7N432_9HYPO|nr:hypothetical protein E4U43_003903 [Claviceps pusilla]